MWYRYDFLKKLLEKYFLRAILCGIKFKFLHTLFCISCPNIIFFGIFQALLSQGIISLAQYMSMMYLKSVLTTHSKNSHEGSIVVEVGSEKCDSEGNYTELENTQDLNLQGKDQIETLKGNYYLGCFL